MSDALKYYTPVGVQNSHEGFTFYTFSILFLYTKWIKEVLSRTTGQNWQQISFLYFFDLVTL